MEFAESGLPQNERVERAFDIFKTKYQQFSAGDAEGMAPTIKIAQILSSAALSDTVAAYLLMSAFDLLHNNGKAVWDFRGEVEFEFRHGMVEAMDSLMTRPERGVYAGAGDWKTAHRTAQIVGMAQILALAPESHSAHRPYGQQCEQWRIDWDRVIAGCAGASKKFDERVEAIQTAAREWRHAVRAAPGAPGLG